jgi:hypothetical protein
MNKRHELANDQRRGFDMNRFIALQALLAGIFLCATSGADDYAGKPGASGPRYTFSWPLDGDALQPRGGTTKGAPITLDYAPSLDWQALQATGLTSFERDRHAILAMAGTYRVTFDFLEVAQFDSTAKRNAPYQSWGTEKIYVDTDKGKSISLVHILEMHVVQQDGSISEPIVTKHWRQDWQYEPADIVEYQGRDRWQRRKLTATEAANVWRQTVYQVDESPRYAGIGSWQHSPSFSTWLSNDTWRPLPRREWSVRSDYQVLLGTNRHTVNATGWMQEENNLKTVLNEKRGLHKSQPYLAREYGVARYERIKEADFAGADAYYSATKGFWDRVRDAWSAAFAKQGSITLRGPVDKLGLFMPLFARADEIADKKTPVTDADAAVIDTALRDMGAIK